MTITREEVAAFADGQLAPEREAIAAEAIAADEGLAEQVRQHRALKDKLAAHFSPILSAHLPENLTAAIASASPTVVELAAVRAQRNRAKRRPTWQWIAGPALAASVALAVLLPLSAGREYATGGLAATLEQQLVANQAQNASTRILLSFQDKNGSYCRAFTSKAASGIACRDSEGWRLQHEGDGSSASKSEYRMAENTDALLLERAQQLSVGPALDAKQERAAQQTNWL